MMSSRYIPLAIAIPLLVIAALPVADVARTLQAFYQARDFVPVSAELIDGGYKRLSVVRGGSVFLPFISYTFDHNGRTYPGNRVSVTYGRDHIGNYQQELGARLAEALRKGERVTVYFDPNNPDISVYDRSMRWGLLGVRLGVMVVFGVPGLLFLAGAFRGSANNS